MDQASLSELVSAALDGERVDVGALRRVLAAPEGRDALAAFLLLRAAAAADEIAAGEDVVHAVEEAVRREGAGIRPNARVTTRRPWYVAGPRVPATWAAALALIAVAASLWGALTLRVPATTLVVQAPAPATHPIEPTIAPAPPQVPARVIVSVPAGRPRTSRPQPPEQPPTPTRVLRFVPGVDWVSGAE